MRNSIFALILLYALLCPALAHAGEAATESQIVKDTAWAKEQARQIKKSHELSQRWDSSAPMDFEIQEALNTALSNDPDDSEILLLKGMLYTLDWPTPWYAIHWLDRYISAEPTDHKGYVYRGIAHHQIRKYKRAVDDFNKALKIEDEDIVQFFRARSFTAMGEPEKAIEDLSALKDGPITIEEHYGIKWECNDYNIHMAIGDAYYAQKKYTLATESYKTGLDTSCREHYLRDVYVRIALASHHAGLFADAEKYYSLGIDLGASEWTVFLGRARVRYHLQDYQRALVDAKVAEEKRADEPMIQYIIGRTYLALGNNHKAKHHLRRAQAATISYAYYQGVDPLFILTDEDKNHAMSIIESMPLSKDQDTQYDYHADKQWAKKLILAFKCSMELRRCDKPEGSGWFKVGKIRAALDTAEVYDPADTEILLLKGLLGVVFPSDLTAQDSILWLDKYIFAEPSDHKGYVYRGRAYHRLKKFDHAVNDFTQALAIQHEDIVQYLRAQAFLEKGDFNSALQDLLALQEDTLEISDQYGIRWACSELDVLIAIGDVYNRQKKYTKAAEYYQRGLKSNCKPDYTWDYHTKIAFAYLNAGIFSDAEKYYTLAIKNGGGIFWTTYFGRAIARYKLKEYDGVIDDANHVFKKLSHPPKLYYILGVSYHVLGDYEKAKHNLIRSLTITLPNDYIKNLDAIYTMSDEDKQDAKDLLARINST